MQVAKGSPRPDKVKPDPTAPPCLYQPAGEHCTWGGEGAVPRQTFPGAEQHVPGEESLTHFWICFSSWLFPNHPTLLQLLVLFFISFLIKDMQTLLWVTAAAVGVSSHQQEQHWVSVCISALRDCLHVPWQAPRMSPKPRLTSNHFHSRLLRLS